MSKSVEKIRNELTEYMNNRLPIGLGVDKNPVVRALIDAFSLQIAEIHDMINPVEIDDDDLATMKHAGLDFIISDVTISKSPCDHEWKHYQGVMESYDYCTKCDEKKKKE